MRKVAGAALLLAVLLVIPKVAFASIGVGVGTGRIVVQEGLKSGNIYKLPTVTVFNTGTEEAEYSMLVTLNESQPQIKPNPRWFSFSPDKFKLKPGQSQVVTPSINLPLRTPPGEYFAYLEAHPADTVKQGTATVGVAAATKLSFKVESSSFLLALLYRIIALYKKFAPISYILTAALILFGLWQLIRRYLHLEVKVKKPKKENRKDIEKEK